MFDTLVLFSRIIGTVPVFAYLIFCKQSACAEVAVYTMIDKW